jgi:hypothetical protein
MKWRLTRSMTGEPEVEVRDDEDLRCGFGFSILKELARHLDSCLEEIRPGVYRTANENTPRTQRR